MTQAAKIKELTESTITFKVIKHHKDQFLPVVKYGIFCYQSFAKGDIHKTA